ncbi:MAG: amino acid adenylation domain-containing protein, partial [Lachnospiraceae bacterium]|nr:amino acid adenylation domain-containing protein [Lachnospiraceae bacterium]
MNFLDEFQVIVRKYPDRAAIVDCNGERNTTYGELDILSRKIASKLMQLGEMSGKAVLVCMGRKMEYIAAEIGIMMAGAAFVPVLPEYPEERIRFIKEDCQAAAVIDEDWLADIGNYAPAEPVSVADKNHALIVYTSGSTGTPKGIVHSMASFTSGVMRNREIFNMDENDVLGAAAPMSFVILVLEYFSVLTCGACTHILPEEVRRDVRLLEDYFAEKKITCAFISPQMLRFFKNKGKTLKKIATGSERVSMIAGDGFELYNIYGCSETAAMVSFYKVEEAMENTPIGKPREGITFFLLDEEGREVTDGEEGELCIQGILADAYLNLEEQSAQTFIKQEDGTVLLHTGDIAKRLPDGNYLYVNRKDWMVKINGQRVETGEIELRMASMPEIDNAVVKAFQDENGQNYLCGYYVAKQEITPEQISTYLKKWLADYMVPRFLKQLDSLPKNANGKLDRTALLPPGLEEYKADYREPENNTERSICCGFEKILHCGKVGTDDDFFKLGGDSINVLKLAGYLEELALTPEIILVGRTPKKIAALLSEELEKSEVFISKEREELSQDKRNLAIPEEGAEYPLTDSQMGVYLECVNEPEATMYNIPMCCKLPADLDRERFKDSVKKAVAMHPAFGVNIVLSKGTPVMCMHPEYLKAEVGGGETEDIEAVKRSFVRPFSFEKEPLYRMALYHDGNHCYFLFDVHHIIFDGTSVKVFLEEISLLYRGEQPKAEEVSLMDLSAYEETMKDTPRYQKARKYFESRLSGEDFGDALIKDYKNKEVSVRSSEIKLALDEEFSCMAVEQFTRQNGISENTLFLGAFAYALGKYNGESKSLFCTVNNGRHAVNMAESVGMFVRTLPIYRSWEESASVEEYLQGVQEDFYQVMRHDCISFEELARDYGIASDIVFVYQGEMFRGMTLDGGQYAAEMIPTGDVQADVSVMVTKSRQGYEVSLEYRKDLYREETARGLLGMFSKALKGMMSCSKLEQIALVSELDVQVLDRFNETDRAFDRSKTIVDLFREQAQKTPEHPAVVYCDRSYSYARADDITDRLAAYIAGLGIGREQVVSVLIPRCEYMAIASLGISKAGAAYQPLDPSYPPERLQFMIQDSGAKLLIADEELLSLVPEWQGRVLLTKDILNLPQAERIPQPPKPEDLFVLLYTSGSTGVPKGCMVEHRNIAAFCAWDREYYGLSSESRVAAYASYGFDACMQDMYPTLTSGATLHIIDESIRLDLNALNQYFMEQGITHTDMTTQIGRTFATSMKNDKLKYLSMGGEALTPFTPEGSTTYVNLYGPTEGTILVTAYPVLEYEDNLPIGKPIFNVKLYILDSLGRRVPVGVPGELCIAGYQVSRGYLNRPEKTKEAYSDNPYCKREGFDRLYHTGDIVRYLPDGNIQFIGRRDGQVKIRGFRIELTEVEEIIRRFPGIKDATVVAFDELSGGKYIAAYVVSDETVDVEAMNAFIEESKPPYMVPAVTMQIDKIPLNQNQKVNKRALPVPVRKQEDLVMPQGEIQQKIYDCVAEVVGHREFGVTTDIYKAGLTSIGSVKLNVLLSNAFEGAVIRNKDLKEHNTVEKLEQLLKESGQAETFERQEMYPLTQTQSGIFVECVANPESTIYNIPSLFRLGENVDLQRLKKAIEETVEAHPYIKTTIYMDKAGDIWQKRNDDAAFEVEISDCMDREGLVKPYQLLGDRLFRIGLYDT